MVAAFEQQGRQAAVGGHVAVAQDVEQVFDVVREGFDEAAFDDAGAALDGVRGAEDGVDVVVVVGRLFQAQQAGFHFGELLAAFLDEDAGDFVHISLSCGASGRFAGGDDQRVAQLGRHVAEVDHLPHRLAVRHDGDALAGALRFLL